MKSASLPSAPRRTHLDLFNWHGACHSFSFAAHNLEGDAAETAASRIHEEFNLGGDLVFCGASPVDGHDKLFFVESAQGDSATVEVTAEMLEAIREVVPLYPWGGLARL